MQGVSLYHKLPFVPQRPLPQRGINHSEVVIKEQQNDEKKEYRQARRQMYHLPPMGQMAHQNTQPRRSEEAHRAIPKVRSEDEIRLPPSSTPRPKDRASFFPVPQLSHHTKSRMNQIKL